MTKYNIQAPDGQTYIVEGPNEEGAQSTLQQHLGSGGTVAQSPNSQESNIRAARAELARRRNVDAARAELARRQSAEGPAINAGVTQQQMAALTPEQQAFTNSIYAQPEAQLPGPVPIGQMVKENVLGDDDPTTFNTGEKIGQMINNAGESLSLGFVGDEAHAAVASALGSDYDASLANQRQQQEQFRENHPVASFVSDVAPAALPGLGTAAMMRNATNLSRTAHGAMVGASAGLAYGAMEGEGGVANRAKNALVTGAVGGLFGAAAPRVVEALANAPRRLQSMFQRSAQRPTLAVLRATKNAAYDAVDRAGVTFGREAMTELSQRVQQIFSESNFDEVADTASGAVLRILRSKEGREQTLGQIDRVRQNLWKRYAAASDQPQILDAISAIDDMIARHSDATGLMDLARAAHATFAKSQLLEDAFDRATRQTSVSGSGGNIANNYMRAVNSILNNRRQMRFFNADEEAAMRAFVQMADEGGPRFRRLIGKMSPNGNGLMMTLHAVGGMASGGATLPLMVAGGVAKNSADRAVLQGGEALQDAFAGVTSLQSPRNAMSPVSGAIVSGAAPALEHAQSSLRQAGSQVRQQSQ